MTVIFTAVKTIILIVVGFSIGGTFADIDLAPPLPVKHRSAWTHGAVVPLGVWWMMQQPGSEFFWFAAGFLPGFVIHLLFDMFPKRWRGGALVKLYPMPGSLNALFSFLWLLAGVAAAGYVFWRSVWPVVGLWLQ